MENVAGEQGLALQQFFHTIWSSYSFKTSDCHEISFFNDEGLKLGQLDISDMLFPFLAFVKLGPFQTPCLSRAELNWLFKFDFSTAVARRLKPFKN